MIKLITRPSGIVRVQYSVGAQLEIQNSILILNPLGYVSAEND